MQAEEPAPEVSWIIPCTQASVWATTHRTRSVHGQDPYRIYTRLNAVQASDIEKRLKHQ